MAMGGRMIACAADVKGVGLIEGGSAPRDGSASWEGPSGRKRPGGTGASASGSAAGAGPRALAPLVEEEPEAQRNDH